MSRSGSQIGDLGIDMRLRNLVSFNPPASDISAANIAGRVCSGCPGKLAVDEAGVGRDQQDSGRFKRPGALATIMRSSGADWNRIVAHPKVQARLDCAVAGATAAFPA